MDDESAVPDAKIWKTLMKLSRQEIRICTGLITGHNTLMKHLVRMKMADFDSPYCENCLEDVEETTYHFVAQCSRFCETRHSVFGKLFLTWNELKSTSINKILKFVRVSKRQLWTFNLIYKFFGLLSTEDSHLRVPPRPLPNFGWGVGESIFAVGDLWHRKPSF